MLPSQGREASSILVSRSKFDSLSVRSPFDRLKAKEDRTPLNMLTKQQLIRFTLTHSLFPQISLEEALKELGFVQIDPIKSPAPAQDLILFQRVAGYRKGDIEKQYEALDLEEDFLYAHGFMIQDVWKQLHPRSNVDLTEFDEKVLEAIQNHLEVNSKDLEKEFGTERVQNWWSGYSRATKMALERLHYYGLVRITRREKGNRIYQALPKTSNNLSVDERLKKIILAMIRIMEPVSTKTLSESMHRLHRHFGHTKVIINTLIDTGVLEEQKLDGITYVWKKGDFQEKKSPKIVRFLCPFDPVVRDRVRFEHLWGWLYQFEAYVPSVKRIRGYYAMPILFGEEMVGWANIKVIEGELDVALGFIHGRPKEEVFDRELKKEIERMKVFLHLQK